MTCVKEEQLYEILCMYVKKCNILYRGIIVLIYGITTISVLETFLLIFFPWETEYPFQVIYTSKNNINICTKCL